MSLSNSSTGTTIYPPTIQPLAGSSWNSAAFGSPIVVQITGTYQPILPSFLFLNANLRPLRARLAKMEEDKRETCDELERRLIKLTCTPSDS
jgi:hypothetical protein